MYGLLGMMVLLLLFYLILITAFADIETAIQALRAGVADFVLKPFRSNQILNSIARCVDRQELRRENYLLKYELSVEKLCVRGRLLGRKKEKAAASHNRLL